MAEDNAAEVLFPLELTVTVRDPDGGSEVDLKLREFRIRDGMAATVEARDLLRALAALEYDEDAPAEAVNVALDAHYEQWLALIARATGRPAEWLDRLTATDGAALSNALWETNRGFFLLQIREAMLQRMASESESSASSPPSSRADTDATSGK